MPAPENLRRLFELYQTDVGEVDETLSPNDGMWDGNEAHYRKVGESAIRCIALALLAARRDPATMASILDLPCGHGRVMRYLQRAFPQAALTACDTDRDGVDFCARTFGASPVYSNPELRGLAFPSAYDLIWCGSLLTHFDAPRWYDVLGFFAEVLAPGGIAVFTTGGPTIPRRIGEGWDYHLPADRLRALVEAYRRTGFGYVDYEGQQGYGISIARPSWTLALLQRFPESSVLAYLERGWDDHQDVVALRKGRGDVSPGPHPEKTAGIDVTGS